MPATPEVVGAYLAAAGEGYAMPTLRRRVAAIGRAGLIPLQRSKARDFNGLMALRMIIPVTMHKR
jgi:hypothetical protein